MLEISGKTKQLGIIGYPVEHSFSPKMHNFISDSLGNDYVYSAWRVSPENLKAAAQGMRALGIRGINVTAPHKVEIMKYLDEISPQALELGSVNTVVNRDGHLCGYNTDADGFYRALAAEDIYLTDKKILVLGAGGVVRPTLIRIAQENPKSIVILNRTQSKAKALADELKSKTGRNIISELNDKEFDIVINTTSAGMAPQLDALPTDSITELDNLDFINENTAVVDMIYNPDETKFLNEAKKRGAKTLNGLGMLIYQGIIAYELFTETKLSDDIAQIIKREVFKR